MMKFKVCLILVFLFFTRGPFLRADISNLTNFAWKKLGSAQGNDEYGNTNVCEDPEVSEDPGLAGLVHYVAVNYLKGCVNVILYDREFEEESEKLNFNFQRFLIEFPGDHVNGQVSNDIKINLDFLIPQKNKCTHYLLFVTDLIWTTKLVGEQTVSKVVIITLSTRWKIEDYLQRPEARKIINMLIVSHVAKQDIFFGLEEKSSLSQYTNMYTHNLLTDPVGSSTVRFLTSWKCGKLARNINLFPVKMKNGFNGKQFVVSASEQPPFTFRKKISLEEDSNDSSLWDGVEIRLLRMLADFLNYTIEINDPKLKINTNRGPSEVVIEDVVEGLAEIGSAGVYVTNKRLSEIWLSAQHTQDCAAFITKASTSLPRYRAILGPFQLSVWITLTLSYLVAIIPLTFADSHSLKPLIKNPWLIEDMFWHVFGTFTNLFTFTEAKSWTKTKKNASRLLIGWYWAFSIIITACYTGSIVSFITLFVFPDVIDHVDQLVKMNFRVGTLSTAGWDTWFNNSEHEKTKWLLRDVEFVPNATQGLKNVSKSYYLPMFRPYAFLAGRAHMEYIVQANYTTEKRKDMLYISKDCFVPFGVSFVFPTNAIYADKFNEYILRIQQTGLMGKLLNEFKWEVERSSSGKLLQAGSGNPLREVVPLQRKLTLDDTQGIYLLLGAGYLIAAAALGGEIFYSYRQKKKLRPKTDPSSFNYFTTMNRVKNFNTNMVTSVRSFIKKRDDTVHDVSNFDENSHKKYDSRLLKSRHIFNYEECRKRQVTSDGTFRRNLRGSFRKSNEPDKHWRSNWSSTRDLVGSNQDLPGESINSLPWAMGSDLHQRQIFDQDRLNTC